jgi:hypothetical protein
MGDFAISGEVDVLVDGWIEDRRQCLSLLREESADLQGPIVLNFWMRTVLPSLSRATVAVVVWTMCEPSVRVCFISVAA